MKKIKLNWKKKYLDDNSGYWYSAKVPILNWEYVVDVYDKYSSSHLFTGPNVDDIDICPKIKFKTVEAAQKECEKHLTKICGKFQKWIESKTYEKNH
jgi:hypothetical protein